MGRDRVRNEGYRRCVAAREHGKSAWEGAGREAYHRKACTRAQRAVDVVEETEQAPVSRGQDGKGETYNPGMPSMCRPSTFPSASRTSLHTHAISHSSKGV